MASPLVSVVLPCFNAAAYVVEAVESILDQTYADLELLVIDDGSTDHTLGQLQTLARGDARVRVIVNSDNLGLVSTLNRGVQEARGEYIARMDADDWSHPDRFRRQVVLLEQRPDVDVVGVAADLMNSEGRLVGRLPLRCLEPEAARFLSLFATPFVHPAILGRAHVMKRFPYSEAESSLHAEDFEVFSRMARAGVGLCNIDEPLYRLRIWTGSVSRRYEATQVENFVTCARVHLQEMLQIEVPGREHRALVNRLNDEVEGRDLRGALRLLDTLRDRFLADLPGADAARDDVVRIASEQRLDILFQAVLKGTTGQRAAATLLILQGLPGLLSSHSRDYLRYKVASRGSGRLV